jgi:hypothetical protein
VLKGRQSGVVSDFAQNLTQNAGGAFEVMNLANVLPDKMADLALRIGTDHVTMAGRYEIEYTTDAKSPPSGIILNLARDGLQLQMSPRRPF